MAQRHGMSVNSSNVLSVIMGGGQGTRLFPLTRDRSKPAVPLAGKYRLVDIPISNCINSGLRRIYLLTQFNSASLHRHISQSYKFDHFSGGFVEILAARADLHRHLVVSGHGGRGAQEPGPFPQPRFRVSPDPERRPALPAWISAASSPSTSESGADLTVATIPVPRSQARPLGIMQIDAEQRITRFVEKPKEPAVLDPCGWTRAVHARLGIWRRARNSSWPRWAFTFSTAKSSVKLLDNTLTDFGKHIIPGAIETQRVHAYVFQGYWEDIGTIRSFFEANLDLVARTAALQFL